MAPAWAGVSNPEVMPRSRVCLPRRLENAAAGVRPASCASSAQRTTLARPTQISHSSSPSGVVSNASLRNGQLHDRHLEQGRERDRAPEKPVREQPVEGAGAVGARVEAVEELGEHEGRECHRPRLDDVPGAADDPARQPEVEREQRHQRHHGADPEDADPHLGVDDAVGQPARQPPHDVVGRRVHAERERRRAVGEEVDPEDLRREQRHRDRLAGVLQPDARRRARRRRTS